MSSYSRYKFAYQDILFFVSEVHDIIVCTCCAILLDATVNPQIPLSFLPMGMKGITLKGKGSGRHGDTHGYTLAIA